MSTWRCQIDINLELSGEVEIKEGNVGENLWDLELQRLTIQKATTTNT